MTRELNTALTRLTTFPDDGDLAAEVTRQIKRAGFSPDERADLAAAQPFDVWPAIFPQHATQSPLWYTLRLWLSGQTNKICAWDKGLVGPLPDVSLIPWSAGASRINGGPTPGQVAKHLGLERKDGRRAKLWEVSGPSSRTNTQEAADGVFVEEVRGDKTNRVVCNFMPPSVYNHPLLDKAVSIQRTVPLTVEFTKIAHPLLCRVTVEMPPPEHLDYRPRKWHTHEDGMPERGTYSRGLMDPTCRSGWRWLYLRGEVVEVEESPQQHGHTYTQLWWCGYGFRKGEFYVGFVRGRDRIDTAAKMLSTLRLSGKPDAETAAKKAEAREKRLRRKAAEIQAQWNGIQEMNDSGSRVADWRLRACALEMAWVIDDLKDKELAKWFEIHSGFVWLIMGSASNPREEAAAQAIRRLLST